MTPLDLARLSELAEKATPGPWRESGRDIDHDKDPNIGKRSGLGCEIEGPPEPMLRGQFLHADAAFIAAFDPTTAKALLSEIGALREVRDAAVAALTDEDEIAHGEAWNNDRKRGLGFCAYCDGEWPCRTQRHIDQLLAMIRAATEPAEREAAR